MSDTREIAASHTRVRDFALQCKCGANATAYLEIHAVGQCTDAVPSWGTLLCPECLKRDLDRVQRILSHGPLKCPTCRLTMVAMSDMIVKIAPLW